MGTAHVEAKQRSGKPGTVMLKQIFRLCPIEALSHCLAVNSNCTRFPTSKVPSYIYNIKINRRDLRKQQVLSQRQGFVCAQTPRITNVARESLTSQIPEQNI